MLAAQGASVDGASDHSEKNRSCCVVDIARIVDIVCVVDSVSDCVFWRSVRSQAAQVALLSTRANCVGQL